METRYHLDRAIITALAVKLAERGHKDLSSVVPVSDLVDALLEIGAVKVSKRRVWRKVRNIKIPSSFPLVEVAKWGLIIVVEAYA